MYLCTLCLSRGYCRLITTSLVSNSELRDPEFIRDVRAFAYGLGIDETEWHEYLTDLYRDYRGRVADELDATAFLNTDVFEVPHIRTWFRDFCCTPCPPHVNPYVRREARERVRVLATILRAQFPSLAATWGVRAANDNNPEK